MVASEYNLCRPGDDISILDIRQAADVQDEVWPASLWRQAHNWPVLPPDRFNPSAFPCLAQNAALVDTCLPPDRRVIRNSHSTKSNYHFVTNSEHYRPLWKFMSVRLRSEIFRSPSSGFSLISENLLS